MPRSQRNDNFIDKTFTVVADILLKVLPTTRNEKEAFVYYRDGMSAQAEGEYAEALQNYAQAMRLEIDPYDRSFIFYNIGLIHTSNGEHTKALEYYYQALDRNPSLPQALNNMLFITTVVSKHWKQEIFQIRKHYLRKLQNIGKKLFV